MDVVVEELLLKVLHGEPYSTPVLVRVLQVSFSTVDEGEVLPLPVAAILVAVDLSVHSDGTLGKSLLLASALVRLRPIDDPFQGVLVILDSLLKVKENVEFTEAQLSANHLCISLRESVVADRHPLHRGSVVDLQKSLIR